MLAVFTVFAAGCSGKNVSSKIGSASADTASRVLTYSSESGSSAEKSNISIACSVTDSFCPYTAKTAINREASLLLYDSLVRLDNSFSPYNCIAESVKQSGKTVTVTLKSITFTDGSALTADDVVYCAGKAKKSNTKYKDSLSGISVAAASPSVVVFTGEKEDPYMVNRLDFPIYKAHSDTKSSSDRIEIPPIGSGRYIINSAKTAFIANPDYYSTVNLKKIDLVNTPDPDALSHNLEVGNISYYYSDLSDCKLSQVRGGYEKVNLTRLVYLGTNMKSGALSRTEMRLAVSAMLDRAKIVDDAYYQNAVSATGIFHPSWKAAPATTGADASLSDKNVYLAQLKKIGYNKKDSKGYFVNSENTRLSLKLVCYKDNEWRLGAAELIKNQLNAAGVEVKLEKLEWKDYVNSLKKGYYDLYLAEVKLGNNMDITELVTKDGSAAYGVYYKKLPSSADSSSSSVGSSSASSAVSGIASIGSAVSSASSSGTASGTKEKTAEYAGSTAAAVKKFYNGKAKLLEVANAFNSEMPIVPVCWRTGIVSFGEGISVSNTSADDVYGGIGK